jgi:hypothetical protein
MPSQMSSVFFRLQYPASIAARTSRRRNQGRAKQGTNRPLRSGSTRLASPSFFPCPRYAPRGSSNGASDQNRRVPSPPAAGAWFSRPRPRVSRSVAARTLPRAGGASAISGNHEGVGAQKRICWGECEYVIEEGDQ